MGKPKLTDVMDWNEITNKIMDESNNHKRDFNKWLLSKESLGGLFFNSLLYHKAYNIQHTINNNDADHFIVISGAEGAGKSTLAIQLACVLSPEFNLKNILFKPEDLIEAIRNSKKGDTFILDEGNLFLFSREAMTGGNKMMLKLFALMRQRNLCIIICVPNFFTLDTYVRDHRVDTLIYIKRRGGFTSYRKSCIPIISKVGNQFKSLKGVKVPFGTFFNGYYNKFLPTLNDISDEGYKNLKGDTFDEFLDDLGEYFNDRAKGKKSQLITLSEAKDIIPMHKETMVRLINKKEIKGKKIGGQWYVDRQELLKMDKSG